MARANPEHTPTMGQLRSRFAMRHDHPDGHDPEWAAAFDRAIAAHDAGVAAIALREAADEYRSGQITGMFLGRDDYPRAWLRDRADQIKTETKERN